VSGLAELAAGNVLATWLVTCGWVVSAEASELVNIPRTELDALKAELKRLRREVGRGVAKGYKLGVEWPRATLRRIQAQRTTRPRLPARNWLNHGEDVSDRLVRFPGTSW
jgi:hypothetical protein